MIANFFRNRHLQRVMGVSVALALVLVSVPCDCLAVSGDFNKDHYVKGEVVTKPKKMPCHSISKVSDNTGNKQEHKHDNNEGSSGHENCCCKDVKSLNSSKVIVEDSNLLSKASFIFTSGYSIYSNIDYIAIAHNTRGSPPTSIVSSISRNILLALLQRFII